jgi:hypothetical protein
MSLLDAMAQAQLKTGNVGALEFVEMADADIGPVEVGHAACCSYAVQIAPGTSRCRPE